MTHVSLFVLPDRSRELEAEVKAHGPISLSTALQLKIGLVPQITDISSMIAQNDLDPLSESLAILCEYDPAKEDADEVSHTVRNANIALQLVKPTRHFLEYALLLDSSGKIKTIASRCRDASQQLPSCNPTLRYQQAHTISSADVKKAVGIFPEVCNAMAAGFSSWTHPYSALHRALVLFCQGYSVNLIDLRQLLWAAALDCLFSSKLDRQKWGSRTISDRLCKLWGNTFQPYSQVSVPVHQSRPALELQNIGMDAFALRNAYVHGNSVPSAWLSATAGQAETGYAYQLLECTEIVLRLSLLRIFEDQALMSVFRDPVLLDSYF